MTTKNSKLLFIIVLPVCILARALQISFTVEANTGFFIENMRLSGFLLSALICVCAVAAVVSSLTTKPEVLNQNRLCGVLSVILGLAVLYEAFTFNITEFTLTPYYIVYLVFSLLGAAAFVLYGISAFSGIKVNYLFFACAVLLWTVKLIVIFTAYATVSTVSEHIFELAALSFSTVFLYSLSRIRCEIETKNTAKRFYIYGMLSSLFCFVNAVSVCFACFSENTAYTHSSTTFGISGIIFGILSLAEIFNTKG